MEHYSSAAGVLRSAVFLVTVFCGGCAAATTGAGMATALPALRPHAVVSHTDTFAIHVNDEPVGTQTVALERTAQGYRFTESSTTPSGWQETEVLLDGNLRMSAVRQVGAILGDTMRIDVTYAGGRAIGRARVPGTAGMRELTVDAVVPDRAVDDNVLMALVSAMPWEAGAEWVIPVFASGRGALEDYTFRVGPLTSVTTPAGTYVAYRAHVSGGERSLTVEVTAERPHHLLRIAVGPVEVVRTVPPKD